MGNRFGERLRQLRIEIKMTQKEFAELVGLTPSSISAYEKGNRVPDLDIAQKIAEKTNVSLDWLCGTETAQPKEINYNNLIWEDEAGNKCIWTNDILKMIAFLCDNNICSSSIEKDKFGFNNLFLKFGQNGVIDFYKNLDTLFSLKKNGVLSDDLYNAAVNGLYNSNDRYYLLVKKTSAPKELYDGETPF